MPKWFSSFACHHRVPSEQFLPKLILPQLDLVKELTWNSVVLEFLHWSMTDRTIKSSESYVPRHGDDCGAVCILPHLGCKVMESWLHWSPKLQHAEHSQTRAPITCFMYIHTYIYNMNVVYIWPPCIAINSWHWCKIVCNYVILRRQMHSQIESFPVVCARSCKHGAASFFPCPVLALSSGVRCDLSLSKSINCSQQAWDSRQCYGTSRQESTTCAHHHYHNIWSWMSK